MIILGLTGGIGTGKSTVSEYLNQKYGIDIIDADKIAREVVEPGTVCYNKIIEYFKPNIPDIAPDLDDGIPGPLNRQALGAYVFANKHELKKLNSITHPVIRRTIISEILGAYWKGDKVVILDVPLLFESRMDYLCSRVVTVVCKKELQVERILNRNKELSSEEVKNRIDSQMPVEKKISLSDYIISNNSSINELENQIDKFVQCNLKAIQSSKNSAGWLSTFSTFWNWAQIIFPPLAILGVLVSICRRKLKRMGVN